MSNTLKSPCNILVAPRGKNRARGKKSNRERQRLKDKTKSENVKEHLYQYKLPFRKNPFHKNNVLCVYRSADEYPFFLHVYVPLSLKVVILCMPKRYYPE